MKNSITIGAWAAAAAVMAGAALAGSLDPIFADQFETPEPEPEPPGNVLCAPDGLQYPPIGYRQDYSPSLEQLWLETTGQEIGAGSAKVRLEGGFYSAMRFDRGMFKGVGNIITFNGDTSNPGIGLQGANYRYVAISECASDLRVADNSSPHRVLHQACRVSVNEGPFLYINWGPPIESTSFCNLDPARTYYFNVIFDNPADGYDASMNCGSAGGINNCGFRMAVNQ